MSTLQLCSSGILHPGCFKRMHNTGSRLCVQWLSDRFNEDRRSAALPDVETLLASLDQQVRVAAAVEFCEGG